MTTYYGVWSGEEWWYIGNRELFCTTTRGVARAQARVANCIYKATQQLGYWRVRAIGEDGLPAEPWSAGLGVCDICGEPATQAWSSQLTHGQVVVYHHRCEEHKRREP